MCTQFPYGWECTKGEGKLEIKAEFQNLGILYFATTNGLGGQYDVYVDGEYAGTINADFQVAGVMPLRQSRCIPPIHRRSIPSR